jgi:hypothetical protein
MENIPPSPVGSALFSSEAIAMAAINPIQHLNSLVLMFMGQLAADDDIAALKEMGVEDDQIQRLKTIRLSDMTIMARTLNGKIINTRINSDSFDALLRIAERTTQEKEFEMALIKAGATKDLMTRLAGLSIHQYVMLRKAAGINGEGAGRRRDLDEKTADDVWLTWQALGWMANEGRRYLAVHSATGVLIRDIEATLKKYGTQDGRQTVTTESMPPAYQRAMTTTRTFPALAEPSVLDDGGSSANPTLDNERTDGA